MAFCICGLPTIAETRGWADNVKNEEIMETRQEPAPRPHAGPDHADTMRQLAEAARPGVTVRVTVLDERQDEEEKEDGYGHGV
jgi:hypothetical protein